MTHAIESLDTAIKNLIEKPAEHEVNKDLQALKEKLEKTIKENEEFDQSKYTDDSVAEMTKVLDQARKTLSAKDANVAVLQEAFDSIVNAKRLLRRNRYLQKSQHSQLIQKKPMLKGLWPPKMP